MAVDRLPLEERLALVLACARLARESAERVRTSYGLSAHDSWLVDCVFKLASAVEHLQEIIDELRSEKAAEPPKHLIRVVFDMEGSSAEEIAETFKRLMLQPTIKAEG